MSDKPGAAAPPKDEPRDAAAESDDDAPSADEQTTEQGASAAAGPSKKKKSKRKKIKAALTGKPADPEEELKKTLAKLPRDQLQELLKLNPALAQELEAAQGENASAESQAALAEKFSHLNLADIMTGLATSGKNAKAMGDYKFWKTQPVPKFEAGGSSEPVKEGPIKEMTLADVPKEPPPMYPGYEWVTVDLTDPAELKEVYELLNGHYVEDKESMFRFNYSPFFLKWALMSPGWHKDWHVGVRTSEARKLVAFISAVPMDIRIRDKVVKCSEVNFLVVHKKLRSKRLAPVLIREVTRRSNLREVWQGIYTAGIVLPKPVSTCRYYHRALNWQKLNDVGFSPLPTGSRPQIQVKKYALPSVTATKGLREMEKKDLGAVHGLMKRYLQKFDLALQFSTAEFTHWMMDKRDEGDERVIYSYVVEDENKKITDFFNFYSLESTVINHPKHNVVRAAYLFYCATEVGLTTHIGDKDALKKRLNELIHDALILAKQYKFDVFNALTLMENNLFLQKQLFGAGDGQLHYYLFNYMANPIAGGVDKNNQPDMDGLSKIGLTML